MKKKDVIFSRKEFLNLDGHNSMANIVTSVVKSNWGDDDKNSRDITIQLDIADCSRSISMELDVDDEYARENAIHKMDVFIDVLKDLRKVVIKECKIQERLEAKRAKQKKDE